MDSNPRIAIVGASVRMATAMAQLSGFDVVAADLFADSDLRKHADTTRVDAEGYPHSLSKWLAEQEVDGWLYTGGLENYPELVDQMANIRPLWGLTGDSLREVRDPFSLQQKFPHRGIGFPETRREAEGLPLDGSWLAKAYCSAGGSGVRAIHDAGCLQMARDGESYFQKRVPGKTISALLLFQTRHDLAHDPPVMQGTVMGFSTQLVGLTELGAEPFAYCGSTLGASLPDEQFDHLIVQLDNLADYLAESFPLKGLVGVDLILDGDMLWLLEINPRLPASAELMEWRGPFEVPLLFLHTNEFGGVPASITDEGPEAPLAKAIVFAKKSLQIEEDFHEWAMSEAQEGYLADIPVFGSEISVGDPILTVLESELRPGVMDRLLERANTVYRRLEVSNGST